MASRALSVGTILGPGGMAGAIGGMFIARFAGWTLDATGSYVPPLLCSPALRISSRWASFTC